LLLILGEDTMQIERGYFIRAARHFGPHLAIGVIMAASLLVSSGCHRTVEPTQNPVVIGLPLEVSQKVDNAQASFIKAVGNLATNYDDAVCEEDRQLTKSSEQRQAMAEANVEIAEAMGTARSQATGGGPLADDEGIIVFEEAPPEPERNRGGWTCLRADGEPSCVSATASGVARGVHRNYIQGHDLNPVTAGDVLEAFAADARWADQYLAAASDRAEGFDQIRQACQDGQSPLARFFEAAAAFDNVEVRHNLTMLRDDFVSMQQNVCEALPIYYENVLDQVQYDLSRRMRVNRCAIPEWHPIWND
jgi:hypothetical protein